MQELETTLDSRLDFMVKYLELGKEQLRCDIRTAVLDMVKNTRTSEECRRKSRSLTVQ